MMTWTIEDVTTYVGLARFVIFLRGTSVRGGLQSCGNKIILDYLLSARASTVGDFYMMTWTIDDVTTYVGPEHVS